MTFESILGDLKKGNYKPVYFFDGDEPYFIDVLTDYIAQNALSEAEREFNQTILYGRDTDPLSIISTVKRFPMMASHQVVIVKEAQNINDLEPLLPLFENPVETTILVINYKGKKIDKRKSIGKVIGKNAVYLNSPKLRDFEVPAWINSYCKSKKYAISPISVQMLADFLGSDLTKISNELEKLSIILQPGAEITPAIIEKNIGISKDYNIFELQKAIGERDVYKSNLIVNYFAHNTKNHHIIPLLYGLYSYFSKLIKYRFSPNRSNANIVAREIGVNPFFIKEYKVAASNYSAGQLISIIEHLREIDVRSKGVGDTSTAQGELMKELLMKIFTA